MKNRLLIWYKGTQSVFNNCLNKFVHLLFLWNLWVFELWDSFLKVQERRKCTQKHLNFHRKPEIPYPRSKKSIMHIFYGKAPLRAHSFIWTNGKNIAYYKFPEKKIVQKIFLFSICHNFSNMPKKLISRNRFPTLSRKWWLA